MTEHRTLRSDLDAGMRGSCPCRAVTWCLFFDTTSTYFEIEQADDPAEGETVGFCTYGHSKNHRPERGCPGSRGS
jgi:hypothetical protein